MPLIIPFDSEIIFDTLDGALQFLQTYTRSTYPTVINSDNGLILNSFNKRFDNLKKHFFKPWNSSNIIDQALLCKSAFTTYKATENLQYLLVANQSLLVLKDYFYIDDIEDLTITNKFYSNLLTVAFGNIYDIGLQTSDSYNNFGYFDNNIIFTSGTGIVNSNLAQLYKVYNGELRYKELNSPLLSGIEYEVDYFVINFNLEGVNYKFDKDFELIGTTSETAGTVKLVSNFTGTLKTVHTRFLNNITAATIADKLNSNKHLANYPTLYKCDQASTRKYLNTTVQSLYLLYEVFKLAEQYYSDLSGFGYTESPTLWATAATATKNTALEIMGYVNSSYFLKKSNLTEVYNYPGLRLTVDGSVDSTDINDTLTISRQTTGATQNYTKLNITAAAINRPIALTNTVTQVNLVEDTQISLQAASNTLNVLDIKLSKTEDLDDATQDYTAQVLVPNSSTPSTYTLSVYDFVKFSATQSVWNSVNRDFTATLDTTGDATLTQSKVVASFANLQSQNIKPVVTQFTFSEGTGTAIATLNDCDFTNTQPYFYYSLVGSVRLKITDTLANIRYINLISTDGNWQKVRLNFTSFTPDSLQFEVVTGNAILQVWYIGQDPVQIPLGLAYNGAILDYNASIHTTLIGDFKPVLNSVDSLTFSNLAPYSRQITRNGSTATNSSINSDIFNIANQSVYHWQLWEQNSIAQTQLNFIDQAFTAFKNQSNNQLLGVAIPGYLSPIEANFQSFNNGLINTFTFESFDPEFNSFYNLCKCVESVARYLQLNKQDAIAKAIVTNFLKFIYNYYNNLEQPPTTINPVTSPTSNYVDPGNNAVIGRIAIYANSAGIDPKLTNNVISQTYDFVLVEYIATNSNVMYGSFTQSQTTFTISSTTYRQYLSYWHSETVLYLAEILNYRKQLNYVSEPVITQFPNIVPQYIDNFKLGTYANNKINFSDAEQSIVFNNLSQGAELTLKYNRLNETQLKTLTEFYKRQANKVNYFQLPDSIWQHPDLFKEMVNPDNYRWVFADKFGFNVRVANTEKGLWNVDIKLKQVLRRELNPKDEDLDITDLTEIENNINLDYDLLTGCGGNFDLRVIATYEIDVPPTYRIKEVQLESSGLYFYTQLFFADGSVAITNVQIGTNNYSLFTVTDLSGNRSFLCDQDLNGDPISSEFNPSRVGELFLVKPSGKQEIKITWTFRITGLFNNFNLLSDTWITGQTPTPAFTSSVRNCDNEVNLATMQNLTYTEINSSDPIPPDFTATITNVQAIQIRRI